MFVISVMIRAKKLRVKHSDAVMFHIILLETAPELIHIGKHLSHRHVFVYLQSRLFI